ncbi:HPr kinase/phosphorylase [Pseudoprimorskyibacter insulae]|uniref:HPr kinase/phosphorylase n=1 Tax=Pseudoprimorskyibacter insulae TaxID=1695997 RepID=A0A2R8APC9_9RHOB|nr:HPr kinase/phosphatase C-terminal domain-containing protein [Pseudoprimorskyibacter insulae]SPF77714.1 HPr kinase/phosphorylase [Pseudoprimorskyibacter insulae]
MDQASAPDTQRLHASAVAIGGRALVITGASGSGKSSLALDLMSRGAVLVGDDQVILERVDQQIFVRGEPRLAGLIEARGIGLLRADCVPRAQVIAVVSLDKTETERLPERHTTMLLGEPIPLLFKVQSPLFSAGLRQYMIAGRGEPE